MIIIIIIILIFGSNAEKFLFSTRRVHYTSCDYIAKNLEHGVASLLTFL